MARPLQRESGRGATAVGKHPCACRHHRLHQVTPGKVGVARGAEARLERRRQIGIELELHTEKGRDRLAREVVGGGPQPSRDDDEVGLSQRPSHRRADRRRIVPDGLASHHGRAQLPERATDAGSIGVDRVSGEELVPHGDHDGTRHVLGQSLTPTSAR